MPVFHWPFGRSHREQPGAARKDSLPAELLELAPLSAPQVLERLQTCAHGLSAAQVTTRREQFGANRVAHEEHETLAAQLQRRLLNPLNILLLTLAIVSMVMGDSKAAVIIVVMVALSLALAIVQERRSSRAAQQRTVAQASLFQTGWFVESLLSQTLIIHIIRTRRLAFIESHASVPLLLTGVVTCSVGIWLPYSPFAHALGFERLPALYWPVLAAMLLAYLTLTHVMKIWFHRRFGLD